MATSIATAGLPVIKAAGGIVLRQTPRGDQVMLVFRERHQDWTLPKGKLKDGESFEEAALREVEEETGCACRLGSYLGGISYAINGVPKVVMFWKMSVLQEKPVAANAEIREARWMAVQAALQRLTHAQERSLLTRVTGVSRVTAARAETASTSMQPETMPPRVAAEPALQPAPETIRPPAAETIRTAAAVPIEPAALPPGSPTPMPMVSSPIPAEITPPAAAAKLQPAPVPLETAAAVPRIAAAPVSPGPHGLDLRAPEFSEGSPDRAVFAGWGEEDRASTQPRVSREDRRTLARLGHELEAFKVELAYLENRGPLEDNSWRAAALEHVSGVERCLDASDLEGALAGLRSARRYAVLGLNPAELAAKAQVLREEARKFSSWRAVAIQRLLAVPEDKLTPARVADAMGLRDESADDQLLRARIVNDRLQILTVVCALGVLVLLLSLPAGGLLHEFAPLIFCGLLGSSLAAAHSLIANKNDGKLPNRLVLPALVVAGAGPALAANVVYQFIVEYFKLEQQYAAWGYLLAVALGYAGERLLAHFAGYSRERTSSGPY